MRYHLLTTESALVYHGGGLLVGSSEVIPLAQTEYLCSRNFVVVAPNYRLAPQVTGRRSVGDCEDAFDWAISTLPAVLQAQHEVTFDPQRVVAFGHSVGGTIAMHLGGCRPLRAVTAFYPMLYAADPDTSLARPCKTPPFGSFPDFIPTEDDWAAICPEHHQISEASFAAPGTVLAPRNRWQMSLLKNGEALATICPDGDRAAIDPMTRVHARWPPTMFVQGDADGSPGSGMAVVRRAEAEMRAAGVPVVKVVVAAGESHMFDLRVGLDDRQWMVVKQGLDWLVAYASSS